MRLSGIALTLELISLTNTAHADATPIDAGTLSGLDARNIGSAAMSGRISALAGYPDKSGKMVVFVGSAS